MNSRESRVSRIVETIAIGALFASAALLALGPVASGSDWKAGAFFATFGVLASVAGYKTSKTTSGSIGFLPFLSIAVIAPNIVAVATVFVSIVGTELLLKRSRIKAVFNVSQFVLAEAAAVATYLLLNGQPLVGRTMGARSLAAFVGAVTVWLVLNKLAVSTVVSAADGKDTREHWLYSMRLSAAYDIFSFPLIYLFAVVYVEYGMWVTTVLALPLLGVRQFYKQNVALQKINEELLQLMVATVEAQDPYTSGHSQRVARYARAVAKAAGMGARESERIAVAALLHDVGKIYGEFAPILRKPGRLTDEEYGVMKTHPARGAALVEKVTHFADIVPAILAHHEAWDGRGYPNGLSGDRIPLAARVIAIADTIDAMSSSRPYREALAPETVRAEFERERGRQFDPELCAAILKPEAWREIVSELTIATSEYPVTTDPRAVREQGQLARGSSGTVSDRGR